MHAFPCFINFMDRLCRNWKFEKLCGHFYGPVWDLQILWVFWGCCGSQLKILKFCIMHFGLLGCLFGWVFHSDSVFKSDGNPWWWWWWWQYNTIHSYNSNIRYIFGNLKIWKFRSFAYFIFSSFSRVSLYFWFLEIIF